MVTQKLLEVIERVNRIFLGVSSRLRVGKKTLSSLPWLLACRQVWCNDTVIGANEPFNKGDNVLPRCGVILMTEVQVATITHQTTHHILLPPEGGKDQLISDC